MSEGIPFARIEPLAATPLPISNPEPGLIDQTTDTDPDADLHRRLTRRGSLKWDLHSNSGALDIDFSGLRSLTTDRKFPTDVTPTSCLLRNPVLSFVYFVQFSSNYRGSFVFHAKDGTQFFVKANVCTLGQGLQLNAGRVCNGLDWGAEAEYQIDFSIVAAKEKDRHTIVWFQTVSDYFEGQVDRDKLTLSVWNNTTNQVLSTYDVTRNPNFFLILDDEFPESTSRPSVRISEEYRLCVNAQLRLALDSPTDDPTGICGGRRFSMCLAREVS